MGRPNPNRISFGSLVQVERPDETTQGDLFDELGSTVGNPRLSQPPAESDALDQVGRHEDVRTREETVANAVTKWVNQLVDLTGRNRLLYYRTLKAWHARIDPGG
jgi:hypothetical protein